MTSSDVRFPVLNGAADAVLLGQVRKARVVVGIVISAVDRFPGGEREFGLLALEAALRAGLGHAFAGAHVAEIGLAQAGQDLAGFGHVVREYVARIRDGKVKNTPGQ